MDESQEAMGKGEELRETEEGYKYCPLPEPKPSAGYDSLQAID